MVRFEQEVQGLLAQLQGDAAAAQAPAASPSPSAAAPSPPPAYGSGGVTAGASSPPGDAIDAAARGADVLAKLAEIDLRGQRQEGLFEVEDVRARLFLTAESPGHTFGWRPRSA